MCASWYANLRGDSTLRLDIVQFTLSMNALRRWPRPHRTCLESCLFSYKTCVACAGRCRVGYDARSNEPAVSRPGAAASTAQKIGCSGPHDNVAHFLRNWRLDGPEVTWKVCILTREAEGPRRLPVGGGLEVVLTSAAAMYRAK